MGVLIAMQIIGFVMAGIVLLIYWLRRPGPCDSCKHLISKGGGNSFRYMCKPPKWIGVNYFDKPPEYCSFYVPMADDTANQ